MNPYETAVADLRRNDDQWRAFQSRGHCVTLAGPGSGKTKVLTAKMARLLRDEVRPPRGVACVTFNNECVRELERRMDRLGAGNRPGVFIGTLHSFCLRFVVASLAPLIGIDLPQPLVVASQGLQKELFASAMDAIGVHTDGFRTPFDRFRRTALDRVEGTDGWEPGDKGLTDVCLEYERLLRSNGRIDFDDIVVLAVRAVESSTFVRRCLRARFPILLVDEYQDLGAPLHRVVHALCIEGGVRLFAVGDPDQSIYGFTGGRPDLLRELAEHADVEKVELHTNYRSGRRIVSASQLALGIDRGFTAHSTAEGRVEFTVCPGGLSAQVDHVVRQLIPSMTLADEPLGEIAILYPTQQEGDELEKGMLESEIPYVRLDGGAGYRRTPLNRLLEDLASWCCGGWREGRPPVSGLLARWRAILGGLSEFEARSARRCLVRFLFANRDPTGACGGWLGLLDDAVVGPVKAGLDEDEREAFDELLIACAKNGDLAQLDIGLFAGKSGSPRHVVLMNFHTSKGTEFNNVILLGMEHGRMPIYRATGAEQLAEQRRLFFVGVSRARREVHILYSGWTVNRYGRRFNDGPSPFVVELEARLAKVSPSA